MNAIEKIEKYLTRPDIKMSWVIGRVRTRGKRKRSRAPAPTRIEFSAEREMKAFGAFEALVIELMPMVLRRDRALVERFGIALERACPTLFPTQGPDPFLSSHAITSAIIRRISRESAYIAPAIDGAARFLGEALRLLGPTELICRHAEWLDRPSARILYRAYQLLEGDYTTHWTFRFDANPQEVPNHKDALLTRFAVARRNLFERLRSDLRPRIVRAAARQYPQPALHFPPETNWREEIARELVYQNYDRAYMVASVALRMSQDKDDRAHIHRLVAVIDANMGEVEAAVGAIGEALQHAETPTLRAHLHYVQGLLFTKRRYAFDAAERAYEAGLACLDCTERGEAAAQLECAWLLNGKALLNALRAKQSPHGQTLLDQALAQELEALGLIGDSDHAPVLYLRYNLLANTVFLLEIMGRTDDALRLWTQAFSSYRGHEGYEMAFEKAYFYRMGLLLRKADRQHDAIEALQQALDAAKAQRDLFMGEQIAYALGFVLHEAREHQRAVDMFTWGAEQAVELRDWTAFLRHAKGAILSASEGEYPGVSGWLRAASEVARATQQANPYAELVGLQGGTPPLAALLDLERPGPKLPAYIPAIDLEATPAVDLNRYLSGADDSTKMRAA